MYWVEEAIEVGESDCWRGAKKEENAMREMDWGCWAEVSRTVNGARGVSFSECDCAEGAWFVV